MRRTQAQLIVAALQLRLANELKAALLRKIVMAKAGKASASTPTVIVITPPPTVPASLIVESS